MIIINLANRLDLLHRTFEGLVELTDETNRLVESVCLKYERLKTYLRAKSRINELPLTPSCVEFDKNFENLQKESKPTESIVVQPTIEYNIQPIVEGIFNAFKIRFFYSN